MQDETFCSCASLSAHIIDVLFPDQPLITISTLIDALLPHNDVLHNDRHSGATTGGWKIVLSAKQTRSCPRVDMATDFAGLALRYMQRTAWRPDHCFLLVLLTSA